MQVAAVRVEGAPARLPAVADQARRVQQRHADQPHRGHRREGPQHPFPAAVAQVDEEPGQPEAEQQHADEQQDVAALFLRPSAQQAAENGTVLVTFFDQLQDSPRELMRQISAFAEIDPSIYDDFVFHVENKTRIHRSEALRSVSGTLNASLEPVPFAQVIERELIRDRSVADDRAP